MLLHGFLPAAPVDLLLPKLVPPLDAQKALVELRLLREAATTLLRRVQTEQQHTYNKRHRPAPTMSPVLLCMCGRRICPPPCIQRRTCPRNFGQVWSGPFTVEEVLPRDNYKLLLPTSIGMHPVVHASKLKAAKSRSLLMVPKP
jgi:hypothetical protein